MFVSDWRKCFSDIVAILSATDPIFIGRIGGSDTDAVAAFLSNHAEWLHNPGAPDLRHHLTMVERFNGYYDAAGDPANFLKYLDRLITLYCSTPYDFLVGPSLLSLYFADLIHPQWRLSSIPHQMGFELLIARIKDRRADARFYPYPFVEKLVSQPLSLMHVFGETLVGKRVLVVSPFAQSIKDNFSQRHGFFKNFSYPEFDLVVYNTPITYSGLSREFYPHANWFETVEAMQADIAGLSFDVALLGCGSYAVPLGHHISVVLQRQAVYVGGILQMMFGIRGRRYEDAYFLDQVNLDSFIFPAERRLYLKDINIAPETATEAFGAYF